MAFLHVQSISLQKETYFIDVLISSTGVIAENEAVGTYDLSIEKWLSDRKICICFHLNFNYQFPRMFQSIWHVLSTPILLFSIRINSISLASTDGKLINYCVWLIAALKVIVCFRYVHSSWFFCWKFVACFFITNINITYFWYITLYHIQKPMSCSYDVHSALSLLTNGVKHNCQLSYCRL